MNEPSAFAARDEETYAYSQGFDRAERLLRALTAPVTSAVPQLEQTDVMAPVSMLQPSADTAGTMGRLLEQAVQQAVSGLTITLDGETVGALVAPSVNRQIAATAYEGRYTLK